MARQKKSAAAAKPRAVQPAAPTGDAVVPLDDAAGMPATVVATLGVEDYFIIVCNTGSLKNFDQLRFATGGAPFVWEGVRCFAAAKKMRAMRPGDKCLVLQESCSHPAILGVASVAEEPEAEEKQFDKESELFDPDSKRSKPRWVSVSLVLDQTFPQRVCTYDLRSDYRLAKLSLLAPGGQRMLVHSISEEHFGLLVERGAASE